MEKIVYRKEMGDSVTQDELLSSLERGVLTLLPGSYAASSVRRDFDARQRSRGAQAWESPRAITWSEWIASLWTQLITCGAEGRLLLNGTQERRLWAEVIRELSPEVVYGEAVDAPVQLARSAWTLVGGWEIGGRLRGAAGTHDSRTFARWAEEFERRCAEREYLSPSLLEAALVPHVKAGDLTLPKELRLVNFPEFTPAQRRLLGALRTFLPEIDLVSTGKEGTENSVTSVRRLVIAESEREELILAARWARLSVEAARRGSQPVRVGILLPDNGFHPAELESVFREVLAPELQPIGTDLSAAPWEFVAGTPLATLSVVGSALDLAALCVRTLSLERASALLRSPYVGNVVEHAANLRFDSRVLRHRIRLRPEISLRDFAAMVRHQAHDSEEDPAATWLAPFEEHATKALDRKLRRSYSEWMEVLRQLLRTAGWPGERSLDPHDLAAIRSWDDSLDEVATLDFAGQRVPFSAALQAVEEKVATATLKLPSAGAPVSVLTLQQAVGSSLDTLIFLRGTEDTWPAFARPHPLIGIGLQRDKGMPGTRPQEERAPVQALLASAATTLVTCAAENDDGPLRPAPLFARLGFTTIDTKSLLPANPVETWIAEELVPDDAALPPLPSAEVGGGARVLKLQAACGFLAFAEMRLASRDLELREAGLSTRESGTLVHRVLEDFWKRVRSQEQLSTMSSGERQRVLTECIEQAFSITLRAQTEWDEAYIQLQKERLRRLLSSWLTYELKRGSFTVAESEYATRIPVGPLELQVRLDRVDQVNGGIVLVDYKSGSKAETRSWLGERPDEPQLPLYTLRADAQPIKAIAYAHLRKGKDMKWAGVEAQAGFLPPRGGKQADVNLADQMAAWRSTLTQLATDFSEGRTEVSPKKFAINCKHCAQRLLCRLDPVSLHSDQLIEDEDDLPGDEVFG